MDIVWMTPPKIGDTVRVEDLSSYKEPPHLPFYAEVLSIDSSAMITVERMGKRWEAYAHEYLTKEQEQEMYKVELFTKEAKEYLETKFPDGTPVKIYPKMNNTITKLQYPLLFSFLENEDFYHEESEHRRGNSFYITETYFIDQDTLDEFKQEYELTEDVSFLLGYWQTPPRLWTDDWGFDDKFDCLRRVERTIKIVEEEEFTLIKDNEH